MCRPALELQADRVSVPNGGEPVIRIVTDFPRANESAFYLRADTSLPMVGRDVVYRDRHA